MAVGWKITRQNPIFPPHSTPSALQASLKPKDQPRSLVGIVLVLKGCAFPYRSPRGPLQQGGTAGTKRLICGAYHGFSAGPFSAPSALQASLKPKDQPRSLVGIVLVLKGCAFPYRSPRGPLQQGGTAGTKRLICGAYHGFSTPPALQASLKPEVQKKPHSFGMQPFFRCGEIGIRTRDTILSYTRFPGVPLKPLEHLS